MNQPKFCSGGPDAGNKTWTRSTPEDEMNDQGQGWEWLQDVYHGLQWVLLIYGLLQLISKKDSVQECLFVSRYVVLFASYIFKSVKYLLNKVFQKVMSIQNDIII